MIIAERRILRLILRYGIEYRRDGFGAIFEHPVWGRLEVRSHLVEEQLEALRNWIKEKNR